MFLNGVLNLSVLRLKRIAYNGQKMNSWLEFVIGFASGKVVVPWLNTTVELLCVAVILGVFVLEVIRNKELYDGPGSWAADNPRKAFVYFLAFCLIVYSVMGGGGGGVIYSSSPSFNESFSLPCNSSVYKEYLNGGVFTGNPGMIGGCIP